MKDSSANKLLILCLIWMLFLMSKFIPRIYLESSTGNRGGLFTRIFELLWWKLQVRKMTEHAFSISKWKKKKILSLWLDMLLNLLKWASALLYIYWHKIIGNVKVFAESSIHFLLLLETAYKDSSLFIRFYWWKLYIIKDININQSKSTVQFF